MEKVNQAMRVNNVAVYWAAKPEHCCQVHKFGNNAFYLTFHLPWPWLQCHYIWKLTRIPTGQFLVNTKLPSNHMLVRIYMYISDAVMLILLV